MTKCMHALFLYFGENADVCQTNKSQFKYTGVREDGEVTIHHIKKSLLVCKSAVSNFDKAYHLYSS